jgi:hypothetical protein
LYNKKIKKIKERVKRVVCETGGVKESASQGLVRFGGSLKSEQDGDSSPMLHCGLALPCIPDFFNKGLNLCISIHQVIIYSHVPKCKSVYTFYIN